MSTVNEKMTAIADEIRELSGTTNTMSLDDMAGTLNTENTNFASNLSIQDDLISQIQNIVDSLPEADGESNPIETCTVTFKNAPNISYTKILFIQYAALDSDGKVVGKTLVNSDITNPFSIQCVCNTCITGIFPPTDANDVWYTSNITRNLYAHSSSGAFFWGTVLASAGETATITFF